MDSLVNISIFFICFFGGFGFFFAGIGALYGASVWSKKKDGE
jgi:hypothetical protein